MPDVRLTVNGTAYGGWTSVRVRRCIDEVAGSFDIGVTELWPGNSAPREIYPGDRCALSIDGEVVITGYVDAVEAEYDATRHAVSIRGRDAAGDLVDCSAVHKAGEWTNSTLARIAQDLCGPFGVPVHVQADVGAPFATWALHQGESVFETLERAARHRGVLLMSDGRGGLVIGKPGSERAPTALKRGENILEASAGVDYTDRHSQYIAKGQRAGSDDAFGEDVSSQQATASDAGVKRYRPLVVLAEDQSDLGSLAKRAKWEASVRAGRSVRAEISVQGWKHGGGVWQPNQLVRVRDPWLRLDRDLLIRGVELTLDERGTRTRLELTLPEAYTLLAVPERDTEAFF